MLKYSNTQKTSATFNGASFSLAAPEDFTSIGDGPTRDAVLKWIAAGNAPVALPTPTLPEVRAAKLASLAAERYKRETAGVAVGASTIMTDRASQAMITGAYVAAQIDPARLIDFKGATGWSQINAAAVLAISAAVSAHVQACFSAERRHAEAIGALTTIAAVDGYDIMPGWASV